MLTDDALALAFRTGLPYVGLRDHAHDPDLDRLIPPDAARAARAVPLGADDDHIRVAVADPDADLSALTPYVADHEIELALAPREEIDAILGPPLAPERGDTPGAARMAADERAWGDEAEPHAGGKPDPLAADEPLAGTEEEAAEAEPHAAAEPDPVAAEPDPFAAHELQPSTEGPDPLAAEPDPDPGAGGEAVTPATAPGAPETVASSLSPAGDVGSDEVPSWLEPPSRTRRVLVAVVIAIVLLACAAALVIWFLNA